MKRTLILITAGTVAFGSVWLARGRGETTPSAVETGEAYSTAILMRYKQCQPRHWRACVLQH